MMGNKDLNNVMIWNEERENRYMINGGMTDEEQTLTESSIMEAGSK